MPEAKYAKYPHWKGLQKDKADPQTIEEAISEATALYLDDIVDVKAPTPADKQGLVWDEANGLWIPSDMVGAPRTATKVVAAYNSIDKSKADVFCDGEHDQEQIQTAIDACTIGGSVLLLEGLYNISGSITQRSGRRLGGQGWCSILKGVSGLTNMFVVSEAVARSSLRNFKVDLSTAGYRLLYSDIYTCPWNTLEHLWVKGGSEEAFRIRHWNSATVRDCLVEDAAKGGMFFFDSHDCMVDNNYISGVGDRGIYFVYAAYNNTIKHNKLYNPAVGGIVIIGDVGRPCYENSVIDNRIWNSGSVVGGIEIGSTSENWECYRNKVALNYLYSCAYGINIERAPDTDIIANLIREATFYGLQITDRSHGCEASENRILLCGSMGLRIQNSNDCIVVGGIVNGCGTSGTYAGVHVNRVGYTADRNLIASVRCRENTGYGVYIGPGCDRNMIHGDILRGNTLGAYSDNGTNTVIADILT